MDFAIIKDVLWLSMGGGVILFFLVTWFVDYEGLKGFMGADGEENFSKKNRPAYSASPTGKREKKFKIGGSGRVMSFIVKKILLPRLESKLRRRK